MARKTRVFVPNQPLMVLLRGNNRQEICRDEADYQQFAAELLDTAAVNRCEIHAYVLMPDHVHLLLTPWYEASLPKMMQALGRRYVRYFNARYGRSGTLWEGRYRSCLVESGSYFLDAMRYVEENPLRAGWVAEPDAWLWSSAKAHRQGSIDHILTDHTNYTGLGVDREERARNFRQLAIRPLDEARLALLRVAAHGGWPLGSERFKDELEHYNNVHARPLPRGRPRKNNGSRG